MPAKRRYLDPMTGDYLIVGGEPAPDTTAGSLIVLRWRMRRGSCPLLSSLGSRFHEITKIVPGVERRAVDFGFAAIDDLIRRRIIREVEISAEVVGSAIGLSCDFKDTSDDLRFVGYTHRVGS